MHRTNPNQEVLKNGPTEENVSTQQQCWDFAPHSISGRYSLNTTEILKPYQYHAIDGN